ncbi:tRNA (uracil-5-)-methyltransferase homolog A isoform X2 [Neoarius graeffei]|nr:tRNA (uracil-5-)-methyltransferase homolog A isoform X2 [Neoarius graeffei]
MKLVHGMQWKGKVLSVRLAKPKADPLLRKRRQDEEAADGGEPAPKRPAEGHDGPEDEPLSVQIANAVTPLWQVPYDEQLRRKEQEVEAVLHTLTREIGRSNKAMLPWLFVQKEKNKGVCCALGPIRPSPVQTEYRNKCEFEIGTGADGEDKTVGFRLGKYKGGSCAVVSPSDTIHIPAAAKRVVLAFQNYIRTTPYAVYSPETYEGHWRQLTVRTSRTNQIMAIVVFHPQKLSEDETASLKESLRNYFTDGEGRDSGVTSLHFVRMGQRTSAGTDDLPCELVAGDAWIHEELLGLRFRISPHSFFQTNTLAAEVLYSSVGDWAQLDRDSTVLDVCCGTGTIGISLAKRVRKVIGIELCQEAVDDAKVNAQANGLTNIEFHCGKAEDIFPTVLNAVVSPNITAIVDPPRAGLHSKVILAIRRAEHLKRLVYVACNAKAAMNNFIDLCRAPSNRVRGAPFRLVRAMAVDLFPQTMHCETILLFERVDYGSNTSDAKN